MRSELKLFQTKKKRKIDMVGHSLKDDTCSILVDTRRMEQHSYPPWHDNTICICNMDNVIQAR